MASENMTLKLLVHKGSQKVLYAEAPKEFVDFLLHLFSLPLGTLIHLVGSKQMVGCLGKLKESVESLTQIYFQPGIDKDSILNSKTTFNGNMFLLPNGVSANETPATSTTDFASSFGQTNPLTGANLRPPTMNQMRHQMIAQAVVQQAKPMMKQAEGKLRKGFVKEAVTYMVMDDLVVKPLSTVSSINFMNSCGVNDLTQLEEKTLHIGEDEALKLLKTSLSTDAVLTTLLQQTKDA